MSFDKVMDAAGVSTVSRLRGWLLIILGTCLSVGTAVVGGVSRMDHHAQ